jgi:ABC-type glycerol-3-phosphate transport system substrate-binding protein
MKIKELIDFVESINPYPIDVFPEKTDDDWKDVGKILKENGKNPDRIFGQFGRMVYMNCIANMRDFINEK